uniref:Uncharacterized protein n=1 Tax=Manihot esculenta TaxID=3983 RepID=A0A2C9V1J0_MANES
MLNANTNGSSSSSLIVLLEFSPFLMNKKVHGKISGNKCYKYRRKSSQA